MPAAPLPIDGVLPALAAALAPPGANAVLTAPPGAGKTTRVPPALLAAGLAGERRIVMLEPRRIAARAAARRIAEEQGWELGAEVGYQVRFERRSGPRTRILVVTEGILLQQLQRDPFLEDVGLVIFDELHERSLQVDLSLALARRVQREVRDDLRLLAMSATLDSAVTGRLAGFLGGCRVLDSPGRLFPVAVAHLEPPAPAVPGKERTPAEIARRAAFGVRKALVETGGDVLVFLPGLGEIQRTAEHLADLDLAVLPLYGDLPAEQQDLVLRPANRRKIVLATNVAETSITVDGVTAVVDSGLARRLRWDPATGLDRLELARISRASATQRAGRAGRQAPGICLRLWPEREHATLPERELPEIARVDLAAPALQLYAWGERDPSAFDWFEAPDPNALAAASGLLLRLGAVDGRGITALGKTLSRLPVHPRLARLLTAGAELGVAKEAALLAALLSERDPFSRERRPVHASRSDLLDRLDLLEGSPGAARSIFRVRDQLLDLVRRELAAAPPAADRDTALLQSLLAAYPDRLVRRREPGSRRGLMVGGKGVRLGEESHVLDAELFVAVDVDAAAPGEARVRLASAVEPAWLDSAHLTTAVEVEFDSERQRVAAWKRTRWEDLLLSESEVPPSSGEEVERVLAAAAAERLERALPLDDPGAADFLARLRSLAGWCPELELPTFSDEAIVRELLPVLAAGRKSFAELRRAPLLDALRGALTWPQREALDREAPERLTVPSGSSIRLAYEPGKPPVLAVRIQELFGLAETPRVAKGRVPVLLHLLAPSGRPQQVTHDLKSFWDNTYPQVRKELAGRYPKHAWPLDPWNAPPQRKGRPPGQR